MYALTHCTIYTGDDVLSHHAVLVKDGFIESVVLHDSIPPEYERIDLHDCDLTAGFVDMQLYGGSTGFFVKDLSIECLENIVQTHRQDGTVALVPTLYSTSMERILQAIEVTKVYIQSGRRGVLGLHIEGPFINYEKRGAHSAAQVRVPTHAEIETIIQASQGLLTVMTIAPEIWPDDLLQLLKNSHIVVSVGHTNATYQQAQRFLNEDFPLATHLYNAMRPFESREPGVVGAIFDSSRAHASIIVDGHHCDFATVRIAKQLLGERLFLISDATFAKMEAQRFEFEGFTANYDGHRLLNDDDKLAGSAITLLDAVRNCIKYVGIPKAEVFRMAATYPAQRLGVGHLYGKIKDGYKADLICLDKNLTIKKLG
ncbi:MAG: N-acetylglucosamine-6-phosphate deacetylase [Spirosomaceae bacterium]|jgi:N-acetylglucosamine-6-phosphate deacetylase|nr:N-acetylglucosamine-6-phosphate deacetylase [Spirosomataceae bacterium]